MKKTEAMELAKTCIRELAVELKGGEPEALTRYLDAMARFPMYGLNNMLMIVGQRPDAEYVAGYRTWKDMRRWVKPGEKGIAIIAPVVGKRRDEQGNDNENQRQSSEAQDSTSQEREPYSGFRVVHVFDVKQTDGAELPRLSEVQADPGIAYELLVDVFGSLGIRLVHEHLPHGTFGGSRGGKVVLAAGMSQGQEFQVMAHELAHELLHQGAERHHRKLPIEVVETEAESVAYVVCRAYGIDAMAACNEYIRLYKGDSKLIEASFSRIRSTAAQILFLMSEAEEARRVSQQSKVTGYDDTISAVWSHAV